MLKKILIGTGAMLALALVAGGAGVTWASAEAEARLARSYAIDAPEIPMPWPLSAQELRELQGAGGEGELSEAETTD